MPLFTAALALGGLSAAGGIGAAAIGGYSQVQAANKAATTEQSLFGQGLNTAGQYFGTAYGELSPFVTGGTNAFNQYLSMIGAQPGGNPLTAPLTQKFNAATLPYTPGYQFTLDQGLMSTQNSFAAQGLGSSGPAEKGAASYATGLAQNTYNQQFQNYLAQNQQIGNLLLGGANVGAGAAGTLGGIAGGIGQSALGGAVTTGANVGSAQIGAGNAIAGAAVGGSNALTGGANTALQYSLLNNYLTSLNPYTSGVNSLAAASNWNTSANPFAAGANTPVQPWQGYGGGYTGG